MTAHVDRLALLQNVEFHPDAPRRVRGTTDCFAVLLAIVQAGSLHPIPQFAHLHMIFPPFQVHPVFRPNFDNAGRAAPRPSDLRCYLLRGPNSVGEKATSAALNLGFLTILQEPSGFLGGYLVLNSWGRPLEFRLSTAVQPNRVQQILYAGTLQQYLYADLIGKALVEKTTSPVQLILTDCEPILDLRRQLEMPVAWLAPVNDPLASAMAADGAEVQPAAGSHGPIVCHPRNRSDVAACRSVLDRLDRTFDLSEPFARIREAIAEARKMGVTKSA